MHSPARGNLFVLALAGSTLIGGTALYLLLWQVMPFVYFQMLFQFMFFFVPCVYFAALTGQKLSGFFPLRPLSAPNLWLIVLMSLAIMPLAILLGTVSAFFVGNDVQYAIVSLYDAPFFVVVLAAAAAPALFEEIALRGVVLSEYRHVNLHKAALMNGLLFAIIHMALGQFLHAFLLGVIFVYFAYYTRSVWAAVLAHFAFNFTQVAIHYPAYHHAMAQGYTVTEFLTSPALGDLRTDWLALAAPVIISTAVFAGLFVLFAKYNAKRGRGGGWGDTFAVAEPSKAPKTKTLTRGFWVLLAVYAFITGSMLLLV